ncbi:MAG: GntR family transcriptional regulator [Clostridiales bacterium GWF2_36_10]|nr:MAG: GntR family transcriptional regulator [Clostridiales bacterium GWF2_36_10]HAN20884.1 GntR family transcriptional regulator [Clostridiales bacterium]
MLTYNIESRGSTPIYIYLYNCIKLDIENKTIKSNEKLPSKRNLAEHLKVSIMTVQNAYLQLLSEGYIYSREKSGYYASDLEWFNTTVSNKNVLVKQLNKNTDEYYIDFCENSINIGNFPFSIWSKQMRDVLSERDSELLRKSPIEGVLKLRNAIAVFLHHFRGMLVLPEQIIIGAGTEYLYGLLVKLLGKDDIYAVEDPGYKKITQIYKKENVSCRHISLDKYGISVEELKKSDVNIVHISPSHHFPTGIVMPIKRRQELLNWANEEINRYVIEDDYDSEFRFTGKLIPTMQSIDVQDKVIYINTFSKTISPAIRISYMVLPCSLAKKYKEELDFYSCTVSSFEQYTLAKFIENGYFERHINRMRKLYKLKRDLIIKVIRSSSLESKIDILEENSGLHLILKLETDMSDEEIVHQAKINNIKISCLSQYCYKQENAIKSMVIINYSGVDVAKVEPAIKTLSKIIR